MGYASGGGGVINVPEDQIFNSTAERDAFFTSYPEKLFNGVYCVVAGELQQWNGSVWVNMSTLIRGTKGDKGNTGPSVELQNNGTYIQWRVSGTSVWANIVPLSDLKGADGKNIEVRNYGGYIQWRVAGTGSWTNLVPLLDLKGNKGDTGDPGAPGTAGEPGPIGPAVEFQKSGLYLQYRPVGSSSWVNLILLSDIKGDQGDPGEDAVIDVVYTGPWEAGTYTKDMAAIASDGNSYIVVAASTTEEPGPEAVDWMLFVSKGPKGDDGNPGDPGPPGNPGAQGPAGPNAIYTYSDALPYALNAPCVQGGKLYRCIVAIETPETWDPDHWQCLGAGDIAELFTIVTTLPATGEPNRIYLVPSGESGSNQFVEWAWINDEYENLGNITIDLSDYYDKTAAEEMVDDKIMSASIEMTKAEHDALEDPPGSGMYPSLAGKTVTLIDVYPKNTRRIPFPDTSTQEATNRISAVNNSSWTVDRTGYVYLFAYNNSATVINGGLNISVNGKARVATAGAFAGDSGVFEVTSGDVVKVSLGTGGTPTATCNFIPIKWVDVEEN